MKGTICQPLLQEPSNWHVVCNSTCHLKPFSVVQSCAALPCREGQQVIGQSGGKQAEGGGPSRDEGREGGRLQGRKWSGARKDFGTTTVTVHDAYTHKKLRLSYQPLHGGIATLNFDDVLVKSTVTLVKIGHRLCEKCPKTVHQLETFLNMVGTPTAGPLSAERPTRPPEASRLQNGRGLGRPRKEEEGKEVYSLESVNVLSEGQRHGERN